MYLSYFGLDSQPFSIVPDHRALFMSQSHREAVAHLLYALKESGGFVQLTGEVGTGKTIVSRYILANLPEDVDVALLLNPRITENEMLESICDEFGIQYSDHSSQKDLVARLNNYLIDAHARIRKTVLIVDEAQNLSRGVLEQIRLLTNLETSTNKLLQIVLIGQPELNQTLNQYNLRQLSQRIIGRFHLLPLSRRETAEYIEHRIKFAGGQRPLFTKSAIFRVHQLSKGIPRLINTLCDRGLLGAYSQSYARVNKKIINQAGKEILTESSPHLFASIFRWLKMALTGCVAVVGIYLAYQYNEPGGGEPDSTEVVPGSEKPADKELPKGDTEAGNNQMGQIDQIENGQDQKQAIGNQATAEQAMVDNESEPIQLKTENQQKERQEQDDPYDLNYRLEIPSSEK